MAAKGVKIVLEKRTLIIAVQELSWSGVKDLQLPVIDWIEYILANTTIQYQVRAS